jgi:hypothetical protein
MIIDLQDIFPLMNFLTIFSRTKVQKIKITETILHYFFPLSHSNIIFTNHFCFDKNTDKQYDVMIIFKIGNQ